MKSINRNYHFLFTSLLAFVLLTTINSCVNQSKQKTDLSFLKFKAQGNQLSGKLFLLGPQLDSIAVEAIAGCDCCASDLAFINDSVFTFVVLCLGGDDFYKGKYSITPGAILLNFDDEYVYSTQIEKLDSLGQLDFEMNYSIEKYESSHNFLFLSSLKNRQVISFPYQGGQEIGAENKQKSMSDFISNLKTQGVWQKLNLN